MDLKRDLPWSVTGAESFGRIWLPQSLLEQDLSLDPDYVTQIDTPTATYVAGNELRDWADRVQDRAVTTNEETDHWLLNELVSVLLAAIAYGERGVVAVRREETVPLTPIAEGTFARLRLDQLASALHDAWISFETLTLESGILRWKGHIDRHRLRYPYELALAECEEYSLVDEAKIGGTDLASMGVTSEGFLLKGNFPAQILVRGPVSGVEVRVSAMPRWERRWRRWHPVDLVSR